MMRQLESAGPFVTPVGDPGSAPDRGQFVSLERALPTRGLDYKRERAVATKNVIRRNA